VYKEIWKEVKQRRKYKAKKEVKQRRKSSQEGSKAKKEVKPRRK